jgi:Fe-S-cluster containining protein
MTIFDLKALAFNDDVRSWMRLRKVGEKPLTVAVARCTALDAAGRCSIYQTKPAVCDQFPIGNADCLASIERRREPREQERILKAMKAYLKALMP